VYRVRTYNDELIKEVVIPEEQPHSTTIESCAGLAEFGKDLLPGGKAEEYQALVHDQGAPCVGPSNQWSCIKRYSFEEYMNKGEQETNEGLRGFLANETTPERVGATNDETYVKHIPLVPKVGAFGPGFIKMTMPSAIRDVLLPWYNATKVEQTPHEPVGWFMNEDKIKMNRLNLDSYPDMRATIVKEMQQVMQWWTQMRVRHTSTYGVRIYRRGSMLINHVDRGDTHLASAVMQVAQDVDENGGWPLEVLLGNKSVGEVYLQPGEIVLYEGAWLRHGRPMRFRGNEFANIFTHFAPFEWEGIEKHYQIDENKPLPHRFHGYAPGRCDTIADIAGAPSACVVTEMMDSVSQKVMAEHTPFASVHGQDL